MALVAMRGSDKVVARPPARLRSQVDVLRLRIKTLGHFILDIIDNAVESGTAGTKLAAQVASGTLCASPTHASSTHSNPSSSYRNEVPATLQQQQQQQHSLLWTDDYDKAIASSPFSAAMSGPPPPAPTNTSREVSAVSSRSTNNTSRRVIKPVPYAHSLASAAHQRSSESVLVRPTLTAATALSEHDRHQATFLQELRDVSALREARREAHLLALATARFDKVMQRATTAHAGDAADAAPLYTETTAAIACPALRPSWDAMRGVSRAARCGCVLRRRQLTTEEEQRVTIWMDTHRGGSSSIGTAGPTAAGVGGEACVGQYYRLLCIQPQDRGAAGLVSYRQAIFATPLWRQMGGLAGRRLDGTAEDMTDTAEAPPVVQLRLTLPMTERHTSASRQSVATHHHGESDLSVTTRTSTAGGLTASPTAVSTTRTALSSVRASWSSPGVRSATGKTRTARSLHKTTRPRVSHASQMTRRGAGAAATTAIVPTRVGMAAGLHAGDSKGDETQALHGACVYLTVMEYRPRRHVVGDAADIATAIPGTLTMYVDPTSITDATAAVDLMPPKVTQLEVLLVYSYGHLDAVLHRHARAAHMGDTAPKEASPAKRAVGGVAHHATAGRQPIVLRGPAVMV